MWKWGFQVCRQQLRPHSISKIQNTRLFTEYRPKHASVEHVELILGSKAVQNRDPRNPNEQKCSKLQLSKWRVYIAGPLNRLRKELCRHVGKQMAANLSEGWAPVKESLPCRHTQSCWGEWKSVEALGGEKNFDASSVLKHCAPGN